MLPLPSLSHQAMLQVATAYAPVVTALVARGAASATFAPSAIDLTHDRRRTIRWDGSMTIDLKAGSPYMPLSPGDLLTNFGTTVTITAGIRNAAGVVSSVPYGVYLVSTSDMDSAPGGGVRVRLGLVAISQAIADYRFEVPLVIAAGTDLADAIGQVMLSRTGVDPGLPATGSTLGVQRVMGNDSGTNPWQEMGDLAKDFGYELDHDRSGNLTLTQPPAPDPSLAVALPAAVSVAAQFESRVANVVVARGDSSSGATPAQGIAMDDDPTSPTYAGPTPGSSPYGRITRLYASPQLTSDAQALLAATTILASISAAGAGWTVTKAFDPTFDPGDVIGLPVGSGVVPAVVDSVQLGTTTTLECRAISGAA